MVPTAQGWGLRKLTKGHGAPAQQLEGELPRGNPLSALLPTAQTENTVRWWGNNGKNIKRPRLTLAGVA